ncbi:hypothetical protein H5410_055536 [Solanum commersonii]|uniref:Uncharacterized protein n=1 Tax=Solanum commersonii TaxID=4109 RepID=A0A9J5WIK6_SOLCO|nr:hypothetical protein H5410_055536 [Solanum commersonii]
MAAAGNPLSSAVTSTEPPPTALDTANKPLDFSADSVPQRIVLSPDQRSHCLEALKALKEKRCHSRTKLPQSSPLCRNESRAEIWFNWVERDCNMVTRMSFSQKTMEWWYTLSRIHRRQSNFVMLWKYYVHFSERSFNTGWMDIATKILNFIKGNAQKAGTIFNRNIEDRLLYATLSETTNGLQEKLILLGLVEKWVLNNLRSQRVAFRGNSDITLSEVSGGQQATGNKPMTIQSPVQSFLDF